MSKYKYVINPHTGKLQKVLDDSNLSIPDNIEDLSDINFDSGTPTDGQVLTYDNTTGKWKAETPSSGGGDIPVTKIYYVDASRSDSYTEDGSLNKPYKTILSANAVVSAGDMIYVLPGNYSNNITAVQGVFYYAHTGHYTTSQVIMTGTFGIAVDDVYIVGFDFQSPNSHAVQVLNTSIDNLHILKNRIYDAGNDPILFNSTPTVAHTNVYINDNYIEKVDGTSDSGIWFYHVTGGEIKNNIIWTIGYNGIIAEGIQDVIMSGNDIRTCRQSAIQVASSDNANVIIEHNYFYGNNTASSSDKGGIAIYTNVNNIKVRYNIFDSNYNGFTVRNQVGVVSADVLVNYNEFINSTNYGIMNLAQGGGDLNAKWNWFGDSSGCDDDAGVINGSGDKITTNVVAEPLKNYGNRATDIRNDSSVTGTTVKDALDTLEARAKVYTFNLPTTTLANGESIQIHRFTVPSGLDIKVWSAGLSSESGTQVSGAKIQIYNEDDSQEEYSTNLTFTQGEPLDTLEVAGKDISIKILNDSGLSGDFNGFISITLE